MARGGGRRTYVRDGAGRFASTPGSAAKKAAKSQSGRTSTLQARSSLKRSRAKLAAKDKADETLQGTLGRRAQKGAVTRGSKKLAGAKVGARAKLQESSKAGVISKTKKTNGGSQVLQKAASPAKASTAVKKGAKTKEPTKPKATVATTTRVKGSKTTLPRTRGTVAKPKGLKPGEIGKRKLLQAKNKELRTQHEQTKKVAASSAKRSKPVDTLTFQGGGIKGPTGAVLKAYTWQWQWGSRLNREGDEVSKRVSNWDAAVRSDSSGKNVVHQFVLEKNGKRSVVSAEGALKDLGFIGDSAKRFGSLKSSLKTYARLRMQQSELERQKKVVDKIYNAKKTPRIKVVKKIGPGGAFDGWDISIGKTSLSLRGRLWNPDQNPDSFRSLALAEYRQNAVKRATGRLPESISLEFRDVSAKIKRMEKKINSQMSSQSKPKP